MYYDIYNIEEKKYHDPKLCFEYLKYLYNKGPKSQALDFLKKFIVEQESNPHISAYYLTLANWQRVNISNNFESPEFAEIIQNIKTATQIDPKQTKAWHKWGIVNFEALTYYERHKQHEKAEEHVDFAIDGFVQSLSLNPQRSLQDILRLITLWFNYGGTERIDTKIRKSFDLIKLSVWLEVIPQIIARYNENLRHLIEELMLKIALHDPQAIIYSLTMAATMSERKDVAETVISRMKENYPQLVSDALLVTSELIRAAILWNEAWHEGITEASWLYYTANKDIEGMKAILLPLHEQINRGPETMNEVAFFQAFSGDLDEAELWMQRFDETREEIDLQQAWNIYYNVYTRLRNKLATKEVELKNISPNLAKCENLELSVPGNKTIKITKFYHTLKVFASAKTHPKRLYMAGSDGKDHAFLLKGHEDLRQDERAMQLFSLVNNLLASNSNTSDKNLAIRTYHVGPLSQSCGLIGWMHGTDTLSQLIQEYREKKNIELNVEKSLIISMTGSAEKYEKLPLLNKIEIFEHAMSQTKGEDLQRILWLQSNTSEIWLERRTNYTRSLATISMVGYILGLGDRHPSNIMLDRASGKIVHVDFGDCFEVAMKREKAPEKVPFRLTRMIENAMEISGIDGNFRNTCEQVMSVLRGNRNSLLAMLEVFLYDPIVGWKLLSQTETEELQGDQLTQALNQKAIDVIDRIQNKLKGTDFPDEETLNVKDQVNRLISEARSLKNLAQHYLGWCPFW